MNKEMPLKEIVTVSEMSRMCRLSRARFYQLIHESVFPTPSRNRQTGRPFFDRAQQEQCLLIRRINKGANGKAVMFYGCRLETRPLPPKRKQLPISKSSKRESDQDPVIKGLRHRLFQLGVVSVSDWELRRAVFKAYPDGHAGVNQAEFLMAVFHELQGRNSTDKLSG